MPVQTRPIQNLEDTPQEKNSDTFENTPTEMFSTDLNQATTGQAYRSGPSQQGQVILQ